MGILSRKRQRAAALQDASEAHVLPGFREVLDCASPLALWLPLQKWVHGPDARPFLEVVASHEPEDRAPHSVDFPICGGARLLTSRLARMLKLSMNRSSESGRGLPHSKTQARPKCFRASARSWTAPVLWRFGFRCKNGFMAPMRVRLWRSKLSMIG